MLALSNGTMLFINAEFQDDEEYYILLRHRFRNTWFLQVRVVAPPLEREPSGWLLIANSAAAIQPSSQKPINQTDLGYARANLKALFVDGDDDGDRMNVPSPQRSLVNPPFRPAYGQSRSASLLSSLHQTKFSFRGFETMHRLQQMSVFDKLLKYHCDTSQTKYDDASRGKTALDMLSFFQSDIQNPFDCQATVDKIMSKEKRVKDGTLFAASRSIDDMGKSNMALVTSLMRDLCYRVAESLLSHKSDAPKLVQAMVNNPKFIRRTMPDVAPACNGYDEFITNDIVLKIKQAVSTLGSRGHQDYKERLISILVETYPREWIQKFIGVGRTTTLRAKKRVLEYGPGAPTPQVAITRPGRRVGSTEDFFMDWIRRKENTESSPCISRDSASGKLVKMSKNYRIRNRSFGYKKYEHDAEEEGAKAYSRSHFYQRNDELNLTDVKSDAGLCPSCHRYGTETWQMLRETIQFMYQITDGRSKMNLDIVDHFETYFQRGGDFYHSLGKTSSCIDWCLTYQLSDPFEEAFMCICYDKDECGEDAHSHSTRDAMVMKRNNFFEQLILDAYEMMATVSFQVKVGDDKEKRTGTVIHLRHGMVSIQMNSDDKEIKRVPWHIIKEDRQLSDADLNHLCLVDRIYKLQGRHTRYIRHLYLDRNQTYGELKLANLGTYCVFMDYMMKLRAKQWLSDSSCFHMLMNKGCSVHVFCIKRRMMTIVDNIALETGLEVGDYQIVWIDSFGSNTTQGGYETLCVIDVSLKKAKEIFSEIDNVTLFSDAGSGYKTTQSILGLRNSKFMTQARIKHWHFNASGEGKRWETDGHNHDIKYRREAAMRASNPSSCTTPAQEVHAQAFDGGIDGSFPVLFEFHYDNMADLGKKSWDGLQGYHDFEYHDDGSIRVWKSYKIGPGKVFSKTDLDKLYTCQEKKKEPLAPTDFPQLSTGAMFPKVAIPEENFIPKPEKSERKKRLIKQERATKKRAQQAIKIQQAKKVKTGPANIPSSILITPDRVPRSTAAARRKRAISKATLPHVEASANAEATSTGVTTMTSPRPTGSANNTEATSTGEPTTSTLNHPTASANAEATSTNETSTTTFPHPVDERTNAEATSTGVTTTTITTSTLPRPAVRTDAEATRTVVPTTTTTLPRPALHANAECTSRGVTTTTTTTTTTTLPRPAVRTDAEATSTVVPTTNTILSRPALQANAEATSRGVTTTTVTTTTLPHPAVRTNAEATSTDETTTTILPCPSTEDTTTTTLTRPAASANAESYSTAVTTTTTKEDIFSKPVQEFQVPDVVECNLDRVPMGGGLNLFRTVGVLDEGIKAIIKAEVDKGKHKASNRQSILEIKETCDKFVPAFMRPDLQEIQGIVSSLLKAAGEKNIVDTKNTQVAANQPNKPRRVALTEREKRQQEAGILKNLHSKAKRHQGKRYLFLAKYLDICMINAEKETRIVRDLQYDNDRKIWYVEAILARNHQYDNRFHEIVTSTEDIKNIDVGGNLSKYIKAFNEAYKNINI